MTEPRGRDGEAVEGESAGGGGGYGGLPLENF